jgi:hypothetical protein
MPVSRTGFIPSNTRKYPVLCISRHYARRYEAGWNSHMMEGVM